MRSAKFAFQIQTSGCYSAASAETVTAVTVSTGRILSYYKA